MNCTFQGVHFSSLTVKEAWLSTLDHTQLRLCFILPRLKQLMLNDIIFHPYTESVLKCTMLSNSHWNQLLHIIFDCPALDLGACGKGLALQSCLMFMLLLLSLPSAPMQFAASFQSQVTLIYLCQQEIMSVPFLILGWQAGYTEHRDVWCASWLYLIHTETYHLSDTDPESWETNWRQKISEGSTSTARNAHTTSENF